MFWFLLWLVLVLGAGVIFFLVGRSLWRRGTALAAELEEAADRMTAISDQLDLLAERQQEHAELAVFADPVVLRVQRDRERRARRRGRHQAPSLNR